MSDDDIKITVDEGTILLVLYILRAKVDPKATGNDAVAAIKEAISKLSEVSEGENT